MVVLSKSQRSLKIWWNQIGKNNCPCQYSTISTRTCIHPPSIHLPIHVYIILKTRSSIHPCITHTFIYPSTHPSIQLSIHPLSQLPSIRGTYNTNAHTMIHIESHLETWKQEPEDRSKMKTKLSADVQTQTRWWECCSWHMTDPRENRTFQSTVKPLNQQSRNTNNCLQTLPVLSIYYFKDAWMHG